MYLIYTKAEYELRETKAATVSSYISTEVVRFIAGEKDPSSDAAWDEFLSTLDSIGRKELMEVCQEAYDRK
jgi:hypothetical protein